MKKYLSFALALPLLFACSSEDFTEQEAINNDPFAGIEKVDATFSMDEGPITRMDNGSWKPQEKDVWGFAWMGDGTIITTPGKAYQNHNLIQTGGIFKPQTSIYVGKYYLYRPYDEETVSPQAINFKSLEEQPLADGYASTTEAWNNLAKTAINIGDKWTNVTTTGTDIGGTTYNKAGIKQHYEINGAFFSNQTGLDLTYTKNDVQFDGSKKISGATDIEFTPAAGTKVGAADIYGGTVDLQNTLGTSAATKSFTYEPSAEPNSGTHRGTFWADKSATSTFKVDNTNGFTFTQGAITLTAADENGVPTEGKTKGWFWFNSLPATAGDAVETTNVITVLETSYGTVTVEKDYDAHTNYTVKDCAYAGNVESDVMVWHPLADAADNSKKPTVWAIGSNNTFINQYGNHKGKFAQTVDFSKGVMNNMHIKNDAHLQKALKYYIASGKTESVILKLDKDANGNFEISKISIALLQTINANAGKFKVGVQACDEATHTPAKIIVTQNGQAELGLTDAKEVPALNNVFAIITKVYLSKDCDWTWKGGADNKTALNITNTGGSNTVTSITNEGTLTVNATNVELSNAAATLTNAAGATMNITQVTTVKNALANLGTINVGSETKTTAELRAYGVEIKNDATSLTAKGLINNYGVVGVSAGTSGKFNNYGLIDMRQNEAITLLTSNEIASGTNAFEANFAKGTNMMGTVKLPSNNPTAIVSVSNTDENGFIEYDWTGATYATPAGIVKYNTIVVSNNIAFTADAPEIQYIKFDGTRTQVVNPGLPGTDGHLTAPLKGIIVNAGKSIIIEKSNTINCNVGAYLGAGATVYKGGAFTYPADQETHNYFSITGSTWTTDQIVEY
jgi:hypothetical protein